MIGKKKKKRMSNEVQLFIVDTRNKLVVEGRSLVRGLCRMVGNQQDEEEAPITSRLGFSMYEKKSGTLFCCSTAKYTKIYTRPRQKRWPLRFGAMWTG